MQAIVPRRIKLIDRYLLSRYLVPFAYCMAAFLLVMLIYDFSINLEDFIEGRVRLDIILEYFIYSLPMKLTDVIPMASLLALLYSIGQLKRHNEITALQASGVSLLRIMIPFLCFGIFLSAVVLILGETLVPRCRQRVAKLESVYMKKGDAAKSGAAPSVFAFYNLRQARSWVGVWDPSKKKVLRVEIREFDNQDRVIKKITAETALATPDGWKLANGKVIEYEGQPWNASEESLGPTTGLKTEKVNAFQEGTFSLPETLKDIMDSQKDPQMMSIRELTHHIRIHPKHSRIFHEERVEYHHKWAYPLLNFLVMLMGVPIGLKSGKGHFLLGVGTSLGLFFGYYGVNLVCLALAKNEVIASWLGAWLASFIFAGVGLALLRKMRETTRSPRRSGNTPDLLAMTNKYCAAGSYVPICQEAKYLTCSEVSSSMEIPIVFSLRRDTH